MSNRTARYESRLTSLNTPVPRQHVLVVDDEEAIRKLHTIILTRAGYDVVQATDGADALERLAAEPFDLVLTDRQMPILDGERMVLAMRSAGIHIPIVMLSGSLAQSPLCPAVAMEVAMALFKPIQAGELMAAIRAAVPTCPSILRAAA